MGFWNKWFKLRPYNEGYLPELDGHCVYFAEFGNKKGQPLLMFHGGPGYHSRAENAKNFDLKKYRVIMFDQRGGGKSKPLGKIEHNTTQDLLDDTIRLLDYLKIGDKIIVYGSSWGTTLALLLAEQYPEIVKCLLLSKVFLADKDNQNWMLKDSGYFYPDIMDRLKDNLYDNRQIPAYYNEMIQSDNKALQNKAVAMYGSYEMMLGQLDPVWKETETEITPAELASNRIYLQYVSEEFMLEDNEILDNIAEITNIPTLIMHNRLDFVCPLINAYKLHRAMKKSQLLIVPDKGHSSKLLSETGKKAMKNFLDNLDNK